MRRKTGVWQWILNSGRVLVRDAAGAPLRAAGIHLDISARKALEEAETRAQQDLREKQRALDEAQTLAHLGSWEWNIVTGTERWSDEQYRIFGRDPTRTIADYDLFRAALHPDDKSRVQRAVEASLDGDVPYHLECRIIRPSGEVRHIDCRGVVYRNDEGRPTSMAGTVLDVTDYKLAESALRASEEKIRSVFESAIEGIVVMDEHGLIEQVNPALLSLLGYSEHELLGRNIEMLMPSPCLGPPENNLAHHAVTGTRTIIGSGRDVPAVRKDGTTLDVHLSVSAMRIGTSRKFTGMLRDISARRRMEEALRESEERFRQLAEHIDAVFWLTSADKHHLLYVSPAFETIWGRPRSALYERPMLWADCIHPEDRERIAAAAGCQSYLPYDEEYRIMTPAGAIRWIRDRSFPVKDHTGTVYRLAGIAVDITAANEMEAAVRGSETRYRSLVELSPNAVFVTCDGRIAFANQACATLLGALTVSPLIGRSVLDFIHPASRALIEERMGTTPGPGQAASRIEETVVRLDGSVVVVEIAAAPATFEGKAAKQIIMTDVTARKFLEQALLSTNRQLTAILDGATNVSIIATTTEGMITTFNKGAEALLGYTAEEMIGNHTPGLLHLPAEIEQRGQELSALHGRPIQGFEIFVEHARQGGYDEREWTYVRKDGSHLTVLLTMTALHNEDGVITGFLGLGKDITMRKHAEVALVQAARELELNNVELVKARDEALQAVQLKADFLATMSPGPATPS